MTSILACGGGVVQGPALADVARVAGSFPSTRNAESAAINAETAADDDS
jgi:hypothetical protein